jgi:glycosyltransferase involved in cell wall biosynthesis
MALNLTNSLVSRIEYSGICVTRKEGLLTNQIKPEAGYVFLERKKVFDLKAILKLHTYIRKKKVEILHAHGTSFFLGCLIKLFNPRLKLVWHDHYGNRAAKKITAFPVLYICSFLFNGIIAVNKDLLNWANTNLLCKNTGYIPNFLANEFSKKNISHNQENELQNLVCTANLKIPKNHQNLLKAFKIVLKKYPQCNLYLIGKKYGDKYERQIELFLDKNNLQKKVFLTGEVPNVDQYLRDAKLGILSSDSEGLPMALLEYGIARLPVVCTDVGECAAIIGNYGKIVEVNKPVALAKGILYYLENEEVRKKDAGNFHGVILENFSEDKIIPKILEFYTTLNTKS